MNMGVPKISLISSLVRLHFLPSDDGLWIEAPDTGAESSSTTFFMLQRENFVNFGLFPPMHFGRAVDLNQLSNPQE